MSATHQGVHAVLTPRSVPVMPRLLASASCLLAALVVAGCAITTVEPGPGGTQDATVTRVVDGDTIKGKAEFERNGEKQSRDWEATRSK